MTRFALVLFLVLGTAALAFVLRTPSVGADSGAPAFGAASVQGAPRAEFGGAGRGPGAGELALPVPEERRVQSAAGEAFDADLETAPREAGAGGPALREAEPVAPTHEELLEFRAFVSETLDEVRAEEAQKKRTALERRRARLDETIAAYEARLDLTGPQADRMRSALLARFDREAEYIWLWEHRADDATLADLEAKDRVEERALLSEFLTAQQVEGVSGGLRSPGDE